MGSALQKLPPLPTSANNNKRDNYSREEGEKATKHFLENREQRLLNDKNKIELSALL